MPPPGTIRALIFDFDGVILDTESALISSYGDVHAAHGRPFDRPSFLASTGHGEMAFDPWQAFGPSADRMALESARRDLNRARDLELPILPGITALIDSARERGLKIALASNSPRSHCEGHLWRIGLLGRFDFLSCRGEARLPKPAPDLYQRVLTHFGLRGHEAIAFEDSNAGSLAARRANIWTVVVPNAVTLYHDFDHASHRVDTLAHVTLDDLLKRFGPGAPPISHKQV